MDQYANNKYLLQHSQKKALAEELRVYEKLHQEWRASRGLYLSRNVDYKIHTFATKFSHRRKAHLHVGLSSIFISDTHTHTHIHTQPLHMSAK